MRNRYRPLTIQWIMVAALVLTLTACSPESSPPDRPSFEPLVLDRDSFVDSFLLTEDEFHRWRFTPDRFVVEGYQQPLPVELANLLAVTDSSDDVVTFRISGKWALLDNFHTLWLTEIKADQADGRPEVRLNVETIGHETVAIEGMRYRLARSLPHREILPIRFYSAELVEILRGDLLRVKENEQVREVQLDGIICPSKEQPYGETAIRGCSQLLGDVPVFVKVYRVDEEGRDVADVWGPNFQYVNMRLLDNGLAWHDKRRSSDWVYATAEDEARASGLGLWKQPDPVPPWESKGQE